MYAMSAIREPESLEGLLITSEDARSQSLMCCAFSAIAIGSLMLGCPVEMVARHMDFARLCKERFCNLADKSPTVPALILYAMAHAFVGSERSDEEYLAAFSLAKIIHNGLPEKDPLVTCFAAYRNLNDRVAFLTLAMIESNNPFSSFGRVMDTAGMAVRTDNAKRVLERVMRGREQRVVRSHQDAHPSFVLLDGEREASPNPAVARSSPSTIYTVLRHGVSGSQGAVFRRK